MNLQESIRRILKEEKDQTKLIKGIIDSSDIFDYKHFCGFDIITPEERSDQYNFLNKNKIPYLIKVYFVGGPNSEVWPRTQAIQNKELDLMEELHEYIKSFVPFNIEMMGSHVNSCDGYKKLMKRKYTTDDLQESIRKVLREEDYSPAGKEIIPNSIIVHKSNPMFRDKIMENGLKVRAGECYKIFVGYGVKCKPAIFATNSTNKRAWFDSTYDDDIWEINTEMIPDVKWYKDRHYESRSKHIVTFQDIPKEAITLKYEGTGSGNVKKWDKDSPNLYESIRSILKEETSSHESKRREVFYRFLKIPNFWSDDYDKVVTDSYFDDKDYNDYYFDNFYDMDKEFGHEKSLFGTRGLPVGHPNRSSKSFDTYNNKYGPLIVRVVDERDGINESILKEETNQGKYTSALEDLTEEFKNEDCVCDIKIEYKPEEEIYLINVILGNLDMDDKFNGVNWRERDYRGKLKMKISKEVFEVLPITFFVEFKQTPRCKDYKNLQESENKKSSLLSNIEENGLYDIIVNTGLHVNEVEQKVGQLSREVLDRFIKDVVKEHFQVIDDDGKTYIIYLEDHPFDVVPIGNNDWVEQLIVTNNELLFLVTLYEEDEYGDLEFSSEELTPSKNLLYANIYEIAGQLGFLLSKGRI